MPGAYIIYHADTFTYYLYSWKQSVLNFGWTLYKYGMQTYQWITYAYRVYMSYPAIAHCIISWGKLLLITSFTSDVLCSFLSKFTPQDNAFITFWEQIFTTYSAVKHITQSRYIRHFNIFTSTQYILQMAWLIN